MDPTLDPTIVGILSLASNGTNDTGTQDSENESGDEKATLSRHISSVISHFTCSKSNYARLFNEIDDFIHVVSKAGTVFHCSSSCYKLLGLTSHQIIGRPISDFVHPEDIEILMKYHSVCIATSQPYIFYCRYLTVTGAPQVLVSLLISNQCN